MSIDRSVPRVTFRAAIWRDLARFACEALAAGLFVSLVLALAAFIVSAQAQAATTASTVAEGGTLRFKSAAGEAPIAAPLLATDVEIDIAGITARARVTQRFRNPTHEWQEGVYVFPLPENASVDHLDMRVGNRRIEGQIQERAQAKATYDNAKQEGRKTTLVEQERPNVFTASVANIGPAERSRSRSSTSRRCDTTTATTGCAFRWSSHRVTSRATRPSQASAEPDGASTAIASSTPSASRRPSLIRPRALSIR
jgi:hypothetical protein